jgi:hypothetical protein
MANWSPRLSVSFGCGLIGAFVALDLLRQFHDRKVEDRRSDAKEDLVPLAAHELEVLGSGCLEAFEDPGEFGSLRAPVAR